MAKETKESGTAAQREIRDYNETSFQTHDPVTGMKRKTPLPPLNNTEITQTSGDDADGDAGDGINATDAARKLAGTEGVDLSTLKGTGENGRISIDDVRAAKAAQK